jgi:hypothetical protein
MIHASLYQPNIYPFAGTPGSIARAQSIDPTANTNFQRIKEIGRLNTVGYVRKIPSVTYRMTQIEYGSFNFWQQLTNVSSGTETVTLEDFKTSAFDLAAFTTDDVGQIYRGVVLYPYMRTSGFALNIGNPEATIERTFDFIGEQAVTWSAPMLNIKTSSMINPYYVEVDHTCGTATEDTIDLSDWSPVQDPDVNVSDFSTAQAFIFRLLLVRDGVTYWLVPSNGSDGNDYTYDSTSQIVTLTGNNYTVTAEDVYKIFFITSNTISPVAGSSISPTVNGAGDTIFPTQMFTQDNADVAGLNATSASIFMYVPGSGAPNSTDYLYTIQSVSVDVRFERADLKEIGNRNVAQLGINLNKVNVKIGRILQKYTIDQVLRGEASDYGKLDLQNYCPNLNLGVTLIIKFFSDDTKQTFLYGIMAQQLAPMDVAQGATANTYVKDNVTLDGEALVISTDPSFDGMITPFTGPNPVSI